MAEEPHTTKLPIKPAFKALFGHPQRHQRSAYAKNGLRSAGFLSKWRPDCRTEGFKTAKHYKNRVLGTTTRPTLRKTSIFELKKGLQTRERSIFGKIEASKRGFWAKMLKKWPPFCRIFASTASILQNGGGQNRQILQIKGFECVTEKFEA